MKTLLYIGLLFASASMLNAEEIYKGYSADRKLLRQTIEIPSGTDPGAKIKASSEKAIQAAQRIFSKVPFLFKSREEVIKILGRPETISDYALKPKDGKNSDLVYLFDFGYGGAQYTLKFRGEVVYSVVCEGIE